MNPASARRLTFAHGRKTTRQDRYGWDCAGKRAATLFFFFYASAGVAAAQTYETPASPVAPLSYTQCDRLAQEWSRVLSQVHSAHQKCLEVHHSQAADSAASCVNSACQSLHRAEIEIEEQAAEHVRACRDEVGQSQREAHVGQQRGQRSLQPQQTPTASAKVAGPLAASDTAVEHNLRSIQQTQSTKVQPSPSAVWSSPIPVAPSAGATSTSVPPMTAAQAQMLQGLLKANNVDGVSSDSNRAALLNSLQTAGQGNLIQQTVNQQTAAILAIGAANDAARKEGPGHVGLPQRITPPPMSIPTTAPGRGTGVGSAPPAGGSSGGAKTPDGNSSSISNNSSSNSQNSHGQQGFNSSTVGAPRQMFVAFAFSTLGLHGFGGDGAWGIGINRNEQKAMDDSGANCAIASEAPDWCGVANGGHYEVCKGDGRTRYVALAINNDGDSLDWSDGEAIGMLTAKDAINSALANCGHNSCQLKSVRQITCIDDGTDGADGDGGGGISSHKDDPSSYAPSIDGSCIHQFWDSTLYNWFAFRNDCGRAVHITFIALSPNDHFGAAATDIEAGQSANTGWSKDEVDAKGGGFDVYVCPKGFQAVNALTRLGIDATNVKFVCKKL